MTVKNDLIRSLLGPAPANTGGKIPSDEASTPPKKTDAKTPDFAADFAAAIAQAETVRPDDKKSDINIMAAMALLFENLPPETSKSFVADALAAGVSLQELPGRISDAVSDLSEASPEAIRESAIVRPPEITDIVEIAGTLLSKPATSALLEGAATFQPEAQAGRNPNGIDQQFDTSDPSEVVEPTDQPETPAPNTPPTSAKSEGQQLEDDRLASRQVAASLTNIVNGETKALAKADERPISLTQQFVTRPVNASMPAPPTPAGSPVDVTSKAALAAASTEAAASLSSGNDAVVPTGPSEKIPAAHVITALRPAWTPLPVHLQPLQVPSENLVAQVTSQLSARSGPEITVRLNPAELGLVRIGLTMAETQVTAVVSVERPEVEALMRRHSADLAQALSDAGFESVDLSFSSSNPNDANGGEWAGNHIESDVGLEPQNLSISKDSPGARTIVVLGGLDLRV